jgi:uncharacterized protein
VLKIKILAAGDFHGDQRLVKELAKRAKEENVDLVVICGDLTHFDESTENLMGPFVKEGKKVLFVPGNHESLATADFLTEFYDVKNLHGYSVRYHDVGLFGCGGAPMGPHLMVDEKEIEDLLKKGFDRIKYLKKKIMVTHSHPTGTKMQHLTKYFEGSDSIEKMVKEFKPDILLCSHVHEAEGIEEKIGKTRVINVGRKGKIIDI